MSDIEYEIEMAMLHAEEDMEDQEAGMLKELNEQTGIRREETEKEQERQSKAEMARLVTESMRRDQNQHWKQRWTALKRVGTSLVAAVGTAVMPAILPTLGPVCFVGLCAMSSYCLYTVVHNLIPEINWFMDHKEELVCDH